MFLSRIPRVGVDSLTVLTVVMCAGAFAQQQIVLTNVTVIDGTGSPAQRNRTVVIKGDRIRSNAAGHKHAPSSVKVIDLQGQTIMPLIVNTHGHLGLTKGTTQSAENQTDDNFRHQLEGEYKHKKRISQSCRQGVDHNRVCGPLAWKCISAGQHKRWQEHE